MWGYGDTGIWIEIGWGRDEVMGMEMGAYNWVRACVFHLERMGWNRHTLVELEVAFVWRHHHDYCVFVMLIGIGDGFLERWCLICCEHSNTSHRAQREGTPLWI